MTVGFIINSFVEDLRILDIKSYSSSIFIRKGEFWEATGCYKEEKQNEVY